MNSKGLIRNKFSITGLNLITSSLARLAYFLNSKKKSEHTLVSSYNSIAQEYSKEMLWRQGKIEEYLFKDFDASSSNMYILDVGCGTGSIERHIMGKGYLSHTNSKYIGVDLSVEMLKFAMLKSSRRSIFCLSNGLRLPFIDKSFNIVVSNLCLHHSNSRTSFISELRRVTKTNGKILFTVAADSYLHEVVNSIIRTATKPKWFFHFLNYQIPYWPYTKADLYSDLIRNGIFKFTIDEVKWKYNFGSVDDLLIAFRSIAGEFYMNHLSKEIRNEFTKDVRKDIQKNNLKLTLTDHILFCSAIIG